MRKKFTCKACYLEAGQQCECSVPEEQKAEPENCMVDRFLTPDWKPVEPVPEKVDHTTDCLHCRGWSGIGGRGYTMCGNIFGSLPCRKTFAGS